MTGSWTLVPNPAPEFDVPGEAGNHAKPYGKTAGIVSCPLVEFTHRCWCTRIHTMAVSHPKRGLDPNQEPVKAHEISKLDACSSSRTGCVFLLIDHSETIHGGATKMTYNPDTPYGVV